jgi:microcompartment protein CcmL/EutN
MMAVTALGMVETLSIPLGILAGDFMLKTAHVSLVTAQAVCAGKYIVLINGEVAVVKAAVAAGVDAAGTKLVDSMVIPNVDQRVIVALSGAYDIDAGAYALGVLETFSLAAAVRVADTCVKAAQVELLEVRLARGMGGKSFITLSGEVAAVEAAVKAAEADELSQGMLSQSVIIPSPHPDLIRAVL